jgi:CBS domain-containing protein
MVTVADVMTREVLTVEPGTPIAEVAELLHARRISGVPVVDPDQRLLGVVSEGDLISHAVTAGEDRPSWWTKLFSDETRLARDYAKTHGHTAGDIMTSDIVTTTEEATVAEAARLFHRHRVRRLPVMRGDKLVGIISRSDLLQTLVATSRASAQMSSGDRAIREQLRAQLASQPWARLSSKNIIVENGVVHLFGFVENDDERQAMRVAAESVPGVVRVEDHLAPELHLPI